MQGNFVLPGASVYSSVLGFGNPSFTSWCTNSMDPGTFFGGSGFGCCWTTVDAAGGLRFFRASISACICEAVQPGLVLLSVGAVLTLAPLWKTQIQAVSAATTSRARTSRIRP